jgi:hypothetical protein
MRALLTLMLAILTSFNSSTRADEAPWTEEKKTDIEKTEKMLKGASSKKLPPAFTLLQFRISPSLYLQGAGGSFTGTAAWAPSFRINPRIQLRAQLDITPANTTGGIQILPGGSIGALYRFTPVLGAELDAGAQVWPGPQPLWPLARVLAVISPRGLGLGRRIPLKLHVGYQPLFGAIFTHGIIAGAEISIL